MMISWAIGIFAAIGLVRAVSFAVWNFRDKNALGGVALLLLVIISAAGSVLTLLT